MPMAGWWPSAWRSSCRCRAVQSGRHPCSVDRPKKRVHSRHSPRLAAAARGTCAACARRLTSRMDTSSVDTTTLAAGAVGLATGTGAAGASALAAGAAAHDGAMGTAVGAHDGAIGIEGSANGTGACAIGRGGGANGGGGGAIDGGPTYGATDGS